MLAVLYFVPAINLGGIPPFSGFVGKLGLLSAGVQSGSVLAWLIVGGAVLTSLLTLYAMATVWVLAFWRPRDQLPAPVDDTPDEESDDEPSDDRAAVPAYLGAGAPRGDDPVFSGALLGRPTYGGRPAGEPRGAGTVGQTARGDAVAPSPLPRVMTAATGTLVALGVALTVVAGPLYGIADRSGADLVARTPYLEAVYQQVVVPGVDR